MFEAFQPGKSDGGRKRRLAASTLAAAAAYVGGALAVVSLARGATVAQENLLDVTFERQLPKKELEPPPAPPPAEPAKKIEKPKAAPPPPVTAAPAPPPPPSTLVPKVIPKDVLPESDDVADKPAFVAPAEGIGGSARRYAASGGVLGGTGTAAVAAPAPTAAGPINLPEEATPPVESPDNRRPEYPEAARAAGREGRVILKIVVTEAGTVRIFQVMKGDPPFVEAATATVKSWRYQPALLAGRPISVFRIVQIPFRLSVGGGG